MQERYCGLSTLEAEMGGSQAIGHPELHSENLAREIKRQEDRVVKRVDCHDWKVYQMSFHRLH